MATSSAIVHVVNPVRKDPLALLKELQVEKKKLPEWDEHHLVFDGVRIHRSAKCGYRLAPKEALLDIGSVWFMMKEISRGGTYTKSVSEKRGFKYIGIANRSDLCDWILGKQDDCVGLVREVLEGRKRPQDEVEAEQSHRKRQKIMPDRTNASSAAPAEPPAADEICYADVAARVKPVKDLDVLVRCPGRIVPNADLILKIAQDEWNHWTSKKATKEKPPPTLIGKYPFKEEIEKMVKENPSNRPIILLPCNKNAPLNLLNAKEFLQHGVYCKPDKEKLQFFESVRPEVVEVSRNIDGKVWTFEVRDSPKNFTKQQWLRTVAVVVDGSDWQFKGWPFSSLVDMFATIKGVYVSANGVPVPLHVHHWAVSVLQLAPMQFPHRFAAIRDLFFTEVELFINTYRERKFQNHTSLEGGRRILLKPQPIL